MITDIKNYRKVVFHDKKHDKIIFPNKYYNIVISQCKPELLPFFYNYWIEHIINDNFFVDIMGDIIGYYSKTMSGLYKLEMILIK